MKKIKNKLLQKLLSAYSDNRSQIKKIYQEQGQEGLEIYSLLLVALKRNNNKLKYDPAFLTTYVNQLKSEKGIDGEITELLDLLGCG